MINAYKPLTNYEEVRKNIFLKSVKGGAINMGTIFDQVEEEGREEGIMESAEEMRNLGITDDKIIIFLERKLNVSHEKAKSIFETQILQLV